MISDKDDSSSVYSVLSETVQGVKKADLTELKAFANPPSRVKLIGVGLCYALGIKVNIKKDVPEDYKQFKIILADPAKLMNQLMSYDPSKFS